MPPRHYYHLSQQLILNHVITYRVVTPPAVATLLAVLRPETIRKWLRRTPNLPPRLLGTFMDALGKLRHQHADLEHILPSTIEPPVPTDLTVLSLNVRVSAHNKHRGLAAVLQKIHYPDVACLQEIGQLPPKFVFHPMYLSWSSDNSRNAIGVAILARRMAGLEILDVSFSPDSRAMQVRMSYIKQLIQVVCVYLQAGGTAAELRPTLLWVALLLITRAFTTILAGDVQYNPGWNPYFPISPPSIVKAFQEIVPQHMTAAVPTSSLPTWISGQGYSGALDHILTTRLTHPVKASICIEGPFPSDHMPILAEVKGLTRSPVPPAMSAKGRYLVPRFPEDSQLDKFREHFDQRYPATVVSSLNVDLQSFSNSVVSSLEATFGPPTDYVAIPRLVQNVLGLF